MVFLQDSLYSFKLLNLLQKHLQLMSTFRNSLIIVHKMLWKQAPTDAQCHMLCVFPRWTWSMVIYSQWSFTPVDHQRGSHCPWCFNGFYNGTCVRLCIAYLPIFPPLWLRMCIYKTNRSPFALKWLHIILIGQCSLYNSVLMCICWHVLDIKLALSVTTPTQTFLIV